MKIKPDDHEQRDKKLFNSISAKYFKKDLYASSVAARRHRLLFSLSHFSHNSMPRVLEVGCGAGFSVKYLDGRYSEYMGVDYSKGLIELAEKLNTQPSVSFKCVNIKDFNDPKKFDLIFMVGVLHHFDNPVEVLQHILTLLKPGGKIIANEPQASNPIIQFLRKVRTKIDKGYSEDQIQFKPTDLNDIFEEVGLKKIKTFPQGFISTPFAEVVLKPQWLFRPIANFAVLIDENLGRLPIKLLTKLSWNTVIMGQK